MNKEDIELLIKKIGFAMYNHVKGMYDYDMLVDYELDYNQWKQLLEYIEQLQQENNQLKEQSQELRSWLEFKIKHGTEDVEGYESVFSKLNELEGGKNE